jgi:exodeoxyribonuclease VII small subunit
LQYTSSVREDRLPKFEECLQRLEVIVKEMERGDLPLEQSLKLFEEGISLSGSCRKELEEAEGKIEVLLKDDGKLRVEAFGESSENK